MPDLKSTFLLMLNGTIILDCCADRKAELEKEWNVVVLAYAVNVETATRHCGLGCNKEIADAE